MWRITRLPAWAQERISRLEMRLDEATKRASEDWQEERTHACIERTIFDTHPFRQEYLNIGRRKALIGQVEVSLRDGECHVTTINGELLIIEPVCGNVITIKVVPR